MSKVEKCYLCNKKETVITVFGKKLCNGCVDEYEKYRELINKVRGK